MLKRLQLVGFKSFADKTDLDFSDGLTAIVGPNGSGKSNIVDAVRWVMGEQSARSLRGGEMADVIFNGSTSRRSLGLAEVTLTFDNARGALATAANEISITRRVYRSGEGEYLINNQLCRLKDIKDLFLGSGACSLIISNELKNKPAESGSGGSQADGGNQDADSGESVDEDARIKQIMAALDRKEEPQGDIPEGSDDEDNG